MTRVILFLLALLLFCSGCVSLHDGSDDYDLGPWEPYPHSEGSGGTI